jgi:hypothetical protein
MAMLLHSRFPHSPVDSCSTEEALVRESMLKARAAEVQTPPGFSILGTDVSLYVNTF